MHPQNMEESEFLKVGRESFAWYICSDEHYAKPSAVIFRPKQNSLKKKATYHWLSVLLPSILLHCRQQLLCFFDKCLLSSFLRGIAQYLRRTYVAKAARQSVDRRWRRFSIYNEFNILDLSLWQPCLEVSPILNSIF